MSPSLKRITPAAPASSALASFCTNGQVPRWISAIAPVVAAGKSSVSQPLVVPPGLGMITSLVGTTGTLVSVPEGESSKVMKSTFGLSSSAAVPATYDLSGSTSVRVVTGVLFSTHSGRLN